MKTTHRQGFLVGESEVGHDVTSLTRGEYDLAIFSSSWDKRTLCITDGQEFRATRGLILMYEVRDRHGLRNKHDRKLLDYVGSHSEHMAQVVGKSINVKHLWSQLYREIIGVSRQVGGPLRIFMDLSTFSRFYALAVLATCFDQGLAESITIFYSEGVYDTSRIQFGDIAFTRGHWKTVTIPSLEGAWDPGKEKYYLVSVGFEGTKTIQVTSKEDPYRVSVLFPNPGFTPEYVRIADEANRSLFERFKIPPEQVVNVAAGDAIGVWKALNEAKLEKPEAENTYYLCCGTKAHSVGLALRGLSLRYPAVLYRLPSEHKVVDVEPRGTYWRYHLKDLSAPARCDY